MKNLFKKIISWIKSIFGKKPEDSFKYTEDRKSVV